MVWCPPWWLEWQVIALLSPTASDAGAPLTTEDRLISDSFRGPSTSGGVGGEGRISTN